MRVLVLAVVCAALTPVQAQIHAAPHVGYDIDYDAPMAGLGADVALPLRGLPVALSVGAVYERVFIPEVGGPVDYDRGRLGLIGRFERSTLPVVPYVRLSVDVERYAVETEDGTDFESVNSVDWGASAGLGVEVRRVFVEGTVGSNRYISQGRVALGYRF